MKRDIGVNGDSKEKTYQAQTQNHGDPKEHIVGCLVGADPARVLQHHDRKLQHLADEAVAAKLLGDAGHDDFMADGGYKEGNKSRIAAADTGF